MANQLPSFLSGSKITISIDRREILYCQALSMSDDMNVVPVGQIGAINFLTIEPVSYMARGSMTITHYSSHVYSAIKQANDNIFPPNVNDNGTNTDVADSSHDGNSMFIKEHFSPVDLLIGRTFDINIRARGAEGATPDGRNLNINNKLTDIYTIENCRLTTYDLSFTPGSLVNENVAFMAISTIDNTSETLPTKTGA